MVGLGHTAEQLVLERLGKSGMASVRPYEEIMRVCTECPTCKKTMTIRNLRYKHRCKGQKTPSDVERLITRAHEAAVTAHRARMGGEENVGGT